MSGPERIRSLAEMIAYTRNSVRMNTLLLIENRLKWDEDTPKEITEQLQALILKNQGATNQEFAAAVDKNKDTLSESTYGFLKMMINSLEFKDLY